MNTPLVQRGFLLLLVAAVTIAFFWILLPYFGAVLWGVALAILFTPLYKRLNKAFGKQRSTWAALATLGIVLIMVFMPLSLILSTLITDLLMLANLLQTGQIQPMAYLQKVVDALPEGVMEILDRFGMGNFEALMSKVSQGAAQATQVIAQQAVSIGTNTLNFFVGFCVMLYLLFFLLRDGAALSKLVRETVPLERGDSHFLLNKFTTVIRATVKGNVVVAAVQGTLGGIAFALLGVQGALLWGVVMALLSLLPAVGAALIWAPVAIYFLASGAVMKGVILICVGVFVIGLIDNLLRPLLVGKDTQMPDYIVLISTIGGMSLFGINGFVIGPVIAALFMAVWSLFTDATAPAEPEDPS